MDRLNEWWIRWMGWIGDGWMDGCLVGWMDGWMGWMDDGFTGWMEWGMSCYGLGGPVVHLGTPLKWWTQVSLPHTPNIRLLYWQWFCFSHKRNQIMSWLWFLSIPYKTPSVANQTSPHQQRHITQSLWPLPCQGLPAWWAQSSKPSAFSLGHERCACASGFWHGTTTFQWVRPLWNCWHLVPSDAQQETLHLWAHGPVPFGAASLLFSLEWEKFIRDPSKSKDNVLQA